MFNNNTCSYVLKAGEMHSIIISMQLSRNLFNSCEKGSLSDVSYLPAKGADVHSTDEVSKL